MKRFFLMLLLSAFAMSGCKEKAPGEVAVLLFNSITLGNADDVKENIYFSDLAEYEVFCQYLDMALDSDRFKTRTAGYNADYKVVSEQIDGDVAYVELSGYTVLKQMTRFNGRLVKVDGAWKVDGDQSVIHGTKPMAQ